ncbi:DUF4191 family protein, partial [Bifidobacterium sp. 64T4]|uniref:DUF4191 family protein n=1 Tax=Bifidobacterium pongonis TaxID=2834432 RepID=UPI001C566763
FAAPIVLAIVLGVVFKWMWLTWILMMIAAILFGVLFATMMLTRRADAVGFRKMEGRPGAAISILSNMNKAGFSFPQEPVWVDPRTKDAIWRGTGYNGIYLIGEGNAERLKHAMDRQEHAIKGVTAGSSIPVYRVYIGSGKGQVQLKDLRKYIVKLKTLQPNTTTNKLMKKIHPHQRFLLTKTELTTLNDRLRTLQAKTGYNIPKGMDPNHAQKISRRAMRGR